MRSLKLETSEYHDILMVDTSDENFLLHHSSCLKVVRGIQWSVFNFQCTYVARIGTCVPLAHQLRHSPT